MSATFPSTSTRCSSLSTLLSLLQTPVVEPITNDETETSHGNTGDATHRVILYNCDCHSEDEVIVQLQKATACDIYQAMAVTIEAHTKGRAICYRGDRARCHVVATIMREIRLQVEVDCD